MGLDDPELRVAAARAFNRYYAQAYDGLRDRLDPVAIVPTYATKRSPCSTTRLTRAGCAR